MMSSAAGCASSSPTIRRTLAGLFDDVEGAVEYRTGANPDPASVGLRADGYDVEVRLRRPAAEFPAIIASPTFAVVPPGVGRDDDALQAGDGFVGERCLPARRQRRRTS